MGVLVEPFRFDKPGPRSDASSQAKIDWPKNYVTLAFLEDYPLHHEVLGVKWSTDTRLYNGHNTTVTFQYFARNTGRLVAEYSSTIPDPGDFGYTYWSSYRVWSWVTHAPDEIRCGEIYDVEISWTSNTLPDTKVVKNMATSSPWECPDEVVCTPGERKCQGSALYECNSEGTGWTLLDANSPICAGQGSCPDFWNDPVGAVLCWILTAFEAMLGLVTGGFYTLLSNVKNFLDNFSTDIVSFFGDIKGWVEDAIGGVIATISDVTTAISTAISDWWSDTLETLQRGWDNIVSDLQNAWDDIVSGIYDWFDTQINILQTGWDNVVSGLENWWNDVVETLQLGWDNVISGLQTWIDDVIVTLQAGWDNVVTGLETWFNEQITILQRGWDNVVDGIHTWINEQIVILERGWDNTITGIEDFISTQISNIQDWVTDFVPELVSSMFDWAKPIVDPILDAAGWLGELTGIFTGSYKDSDEYKEYIRKNKEDRERTKEILEEE